MQAGTQLTLNKGLKTGFFQTTCPVKTETVV